MKNLFGKIFNNTKSEIDTTSKVVHKELYDISEIKKIYNNYKLLDNKSLWQQEPFKSCLEQSKSYMCVQFHEKMIATSLNSDTDCIIHLSDHNIHVMLIVDKRPVIIFECIVSSYSNYIEEVNPHLENGQTWISQIDKVQSLKCWWGTGDNTCICLYNKPWIWDDKKNTRIESDADLSGVINLSNKTLKSILKKVNLLTSVYKSQNEYNNKIIEQQREQKIVDYNKMLNKIVDNSNSVDFSNTVLPSEIKLVREGNEYVIK